MENTQRFSGRADVYDNYRPGYTDDMYDYIYANMLKSGGAVADIGSGTGILSEGFLKRGSAVYGVEPNADMRAAGEKRLKDYKSFISVIGTADKTTLDAGSVDLITAASAFHWFDPVLFSAECRRILRPGGSVAIIYNKRDKNSAFVQELTSNSERLDSAAPTKNEDIAGFFQGNYSTERFENTVSYNLTEFIGNLLSHSRAPLKEDAGYEEYVETMTELFHKFEQGGRVLMPYITYIYHGILK